MPSPETLEHFIAAVEGERPRRRDRALLRADASMQENESEPRRGREALVANERAVLARMRS
jgi:hypothetical protein